MQIEELEKTQANKKVSLEKLATEKSIERLVRQEAAAANVDNL